MQLKKIAQAFLALVLTVSAHAETVRVGNVVWNKSASGSIDEFRNLTYDNRAGGMVFIRPSSNNQRAKESSTNVAIDDRFLVSAGAVQLSAVSTGIHINDLSADPVLVTVQPRQVLYFMISTDSDYRPILQQVDANTARSLLQNTYRQGHQISRVDVNNCPEPVIAPPPVYTPPPQVNNPPPVREEVPTLRLDIHFDHDKHNIKPEFKGEIVKAAQFLAKYPGMDAIIEGHTDSNGTDQYNIGLSQRRANTVREALIRDHGVNPSRLRAVGYGESRPIANNATPEGRYTNRRVMVVIPPQ